jgi:fructose-1,6-bisphosphatase I
MNVQGNAGSWDAATREYVEKCKTGPKPYSLRYIGSMVADVHRTILYGGVFMYPADKKVRLACAFLFAACH